MTSPLGAFGNERLELLGTLGLTVDIPTLTIAQLRSYSRLSLEARQEQPNLFDASGNLRADALQQVSGSLVVLNSAAATTAVGTITGKFQVFDQSGNSLGFVPLYATIT